MTVKQLIQELGLLNPDKKVVIEFPTPVWVDITSSFKVEETPTRIKITVIPE